jgi:hypothetical protein
MAIINIVAPGRRGPAPPCQICQRGDHGGRVPIASLYVNSSRSAIPSGGRRDLSDFAPMGSKPCCSPFTTPRFYSQCQASKVSHSAPESQFAAKSDRTRALCAKYEDVPQYPAAFPLLEQAQEANARICVNPQVLAEFYAVITNPRRVSAPFTSDEALAEIAKVRALPGLTLLPVPLDVVDRWVALLRLHPVTGRVACGGYFLETHGTPLHGKRVPADWT